MSVIAISQPLVLGQAIRAARKQKGLTQVELAAALGTYPRAVIELERGRSSADLTLILNALELVGLRMKLESA